MPAHVIAGEITIRCFASEPTLLAAPPGPDLANSSIIISRVVGRESFAAGCAAQASTQGSTLRVGVASEPSVERTYTVEEVGISAISIAVVPDHFLEALLALIRTLPLLVVVARSGVL